jgi:hypothetical protein
MPDGQSDREKDGGGATDTPAGLLRRTRASLISGTSVSSNLETVGYGDIWRKISASDCIARIPSFVSLIGSLRR